MLSPHDKLQYIACKLQHRGRKYEIRLFKLIYYTSLTRSFCVIYYDTIVLTYTVMCTFIYIKFDAENAMQTTKIIIMLFPLFNSPILQNMFFFLLFQNMEGFI